MSNKIKSYIVSADRITGEWLDTPLYTARVSRADWDKKKDTAGCHYDTFEREFETCAVKVIWVD